MDSDTEQKILRSTSLALRYLLLQKQRRNEVNSIFKDRKLNGQYYVLFPKLQQDEQKFFEYMRMSKRTFDYILGKIEHLITKQPTHVPYISPEERLMVTLRFLSTGIPFKSLSFSFCMAHNTIGNIIYETCDAIWNTLNSEFIPLPTTSAFERVEKEFLDQWNFPNCLGAIDGKHVRIKAPAKSGTQYFNYKKYFSLHLQGVADANCKFICVDIGEYGSRCDSGVFNSSTLYELTRSNRLNIPAPKPLPGTTRSLPYVFIGDQGYPLKNFLLRPYPDNNADAAKLHFNERLSIARRCVECAFGILVAKWRFLKTELQITPDHATVLVKAACLLHNLCIDFRETVTTPGDSNSGSVNCNSNARYRANNHASREATEIRDSFKDYFCSRHE
ncbi:protein ALP1-like [Anopheles stephensi]|uniref:protein ALP1-like n=1 Tax=Anopheles stephensi TaxID=30069 RepID=UPI001658C05A|nr:protein ALP1-like [Anopheles stephensi]